MNKFVALVFICIGIFLLLYNRPAPRSDLTESQAKVVQIVPHPGTRYNIEIVTTKGMMLSCRENALRQWPPDIINRCPIEKFYPLLGQNVTVVHDGRFIYEVKSNGNSILPYGVFRRVQMMMDIVAFLMIGIGAITWRRADLEA